METTMQPNGNETNTSEENPLLSKEELEAFHQKMANQVVGNHTKFEKNRHRMVMTPKPGFTFNPLKSLPRNSLCPCQSGKKFKKCHLNQLPEVISEKDANLYRNTMRIHKQIRFVTKDMNPALPEETVKETFDADSGNPTEAHQGNDV